MNWKQIILTSKFGKFIKRSETNTFNVLEGGIRSSKTTTLILAFCRHLEGLKYDTLNLAFAESISTAKVVLQENNGLGIKPYFADKAQEIKYKGKDALIVNVNGHTHTIVFVASANADSYEAIRGMSITSVIGTEINLSHPTFMAEVIGRTLHSKDRKLFFDLNPTSPGHYIYKDYIDVWVDGAKAKTLQGGVNYETTSLYDNPALTDAQKAAIASQYDTTSNWYKSLILGMRINPDENVYTLYDYNLAAEMPKPDNYVIAVDIGISASATTFVCLGRKDEKLYIYDIYYHKNGKAIEGRNIKQPFDYAKDLAAFYVKQRDRFGHGARYILIDNDISFLRIIQQAFTDTEAPKGIVKYALKQEIQTRIIAVTNLLYTGRLIIQNDLQLVIDAIRNAKYDKDEMDKGKMKRLDDTNMEINPVDILDSIEYAVTYYSGLMR
jgi:PBSX family phage terminase large subunit